MTQRKKVKIEASQRLKRKITARTTPLSLAADVGLREIKRLLFTLGYQVKTENKRAFYYTRFYKELEDGKFHSYEIVGWHGQGIYGRERTIFELYDSDKGSKPVVAIGLLTDDSLTAERQRLIADDIVRYIKKRA